MNEIKILPVYKHIGGIWGRIGVAHIWTNTRPSANRKEAMQNNLNNFGHISRRKRVIPFSMKGASRNSQFSHFIIGNSFAGFIL